MYHSMHAVASFWENSMFVRILFITLAFGLAEPDKEVTDGEKKAFLTKLAKLPSKGEFFTDEAVKTAVPDMRVLLALTKKDVPENNIYPVLALSRGLVDLKEPRQYGITHFAKIAHPTIKLSWAVMLFDKEAASPEIVTFLRKGLESKEEAQSLSGILGPGFEEFK